MRWLVFLLLVILAGCAAQQPEAMEHVMEAGSPADYRVTLATMPSLVEPEKETELEITIAHADGTPVDMEEMHERMMHVMLIRDDLRHFAHIHPEDFGGVDDTNKLSLKHVFPQPGRYRVMVEFSENGKTVAVPNTVLVSGDYRPLPIEEDYAREKRSDGYTVKLEAPDPLIAGVASMLAFPVTKDGAPVDFELFLGEKMHLAVWKEQLGHFEHAHPVEMNGQIMFHVAFPTPGVYKLYPQFQHQGKVVTGEFVVRVT
jgi:hypothetical protein